MLRADDDRHACQEGSEPALDVGLDVVRMHDVGADLAQVSGEPPDTPEHAVAWPRDAVHGHAEPREPLGPRALLVEAHNTRAEAVAIDALDQIQHDPFEPTHVQGSDDVNDAARAMRSHSDTSPRQNGLDGAEDDPRIHGE